MVKFYFTQTGMLHLHKRRVLNIIFFVPAAENIVKNIVLISASAQVWLQIGISCTQNWA